MLFPSKYNYLQLIRIFTEQAGVLVEVLRLWELYKGCRTHDADLSER